MHIWHRILLLSLWTVFAVVLFAFSHRSLARNSRNPLALHPPESEIYTRWPYPNYNSLGWRWKWKGRFEPCTGPEDVSYHDASPYLIRPHPDRLESPRSPTIGHAAGLDVDPAVCFDSIGRLGPYGYRQEENRTQEGETESSVQVDWSQVKWGELQDRCLNSNRARYAPHPHFLRKQLASNDLPPDSNQAPTHPEFTQAHQNLHPRTALLIRSWTGYEYRENDVQSIRALVTELSLLSGAEYEVFLLVNVKNMRLPIWTDRSVYQRVLDDNVPQELHDMTILFNENVFEEWYPDVGDWQIYWHQFMPLQWFSKTRPEFDFVWNWEVDTRYIGNHYHLLEQASQFARTAPRKFLWERNTRFYIPTAHGKYGKWVNETHSLIESAMKSGEMDPVWGPQPYGGFGQQLFGPSPPTSLDDDDFEWGVGEEADLVTLLPIWDPAHTEWGLKNKIFNFIPGIRPHFSPEDGADRNFFHPQLVNISRRVYINTVSRFSKRQLHAMHMENRAGRTMCSEMWPATASLHHGLKAVYAPHPIWTEDVPVPAEMDAALNADAGRPAHWGIESDSVYNGDHEFNFENTTWYYNAKFPRKLYLEWLGVSSGESGISQESTSGVGSFVNVSSNGEGRMSLCLPQMLLHPFKHV